MASGGEGTVVIATSTAFAPTFQGDSQRLSGMIDLLRDDGWRVVVVYLATEFAVAPDVDLMRQGCDELHVVPLEPEDRARRRDDPDSWCPDRMVARVRHVCEAVRPDVLLAHFVFMSRCLDACGDIVPRLVLDADNIMEGRRRAHDELGFDYNWFSTTREQELAALRRAHVLLAIQGEELAHFREQAPDIEAVCVPPIFSPRPTARPQDTTVGFLGSENPVNRAAVRTLVEGIVPRSRALGTRASFVLAGAVDLPRALGPGWREALDRHDIGHLGVVTDAASFYARCTAVVNPVAYGTGMSIKSVEALSFARPVITTPAGARGLPTPLPEHVHVATDPDGLAACIVEATARDLPDEDAFGYVRALRDEAGRGLRDAFAGGELRTATG